MIENSFMQQDEEFSLNPFSDLWDFEEVNFGFL